jgi:hypothetical protein
MRNRVITAVIVGLGHVVVAILVWVQRLPIESEQSAFDAGTIFFFSTNTTGKGSGEQSGQPTLKPLHLKPQKVDVSGLLRFSVPGVAPLPPLPESPAPAAIGWQDSLNEVVSAVIEHARVEADRPMNRPQRSPSFSPLHEKPHSLEWITQHSHEVIDEHGVPQWVLVQPCESEFLVQKPDCTVARVLPHGTMFEYMTEQHDATLQYGGPNAVP